MRIHKGKIATRLTYILVIAVFVSLSYTYAEVMGKASTLFFGNDQKIMDSTMSLKDMSVRDQAVENKKAGTKATRSAESTGKVVQAEKQDEMQKDITQRESKDIEFDRIFVQDYNSDIKHNSSVELSSIALDIESDDLQETTHQRLRNTQKSEKGRSEKTVEIVDLSKVHVVSNREEQVSRSDGIQQVPIADAMLKNLGIEGWDHPLTNLLDN